MRVIFTFFLLSFSLLTLSAQADKSKRKSPPVLFEDHIDGIAVSIDYSSPAARGRTLWGGLVPYGLIWRTGANEATKISFDSDVLIEGLKLPGGIYSLFTIPDEENWTVIFNKEADQWGHYNYDKTQDILRINVIPYTSSDLFAEHLVFSVVDNKIQLQWGNLIVPFSVSPGQ